MEVNGPSSGAARQGAIDFANETYYLAGKLLVTSPAPSEGAFERSLKNQIHMGTYILKSLHWKVDLDKNNCV